MFRKYVGYFTSIRTSNNINSLRSSSNKTFLKIAPRLLFLVGKLCLGEVLEFNCVLILGSWELWLFLHRNSVLNIFSGSMESLNFFSCNILKSRALIWTKWWYTSASAVPLLSNLWSLLCTINSWSTLVLGHGWKNRKTYCGKTGNRGMIDLATGEKRSGCGTS